MQEDEKRWRIHGIFREVKPPLRLVFTWLWENDPIHGESGDSLVTIEFHDRGGRTEVVLTHEQLPSAVSREEHASGWQRCLEDIARWVS